MIKTQTRKGGVDRGNRERKADERVLQHVWLGVWEHVCESVYVDVCVYKGGVWELTLVLNDLIEGPSLPWREKGGRVMTGWRSSGGGGLYGTGSHYHCSNLPSGTHKGEVRGQITALKWGCFLMLMLWPTTPFGPGVLGHHQGPHAEGSGCSR